MDRDGVIFVLGMVFAMLSFIGFLVYQSNSQDRYMIENGFKWTPSTSGHWSKEVK